MSALVKGLLDYSLLGKDSVGSILDCNKIIGEALSDLAGLIRESNAKITVNELPAIYGYQAEIKLLFQNLINN